jgi:inorganic pyrophosphatase
MCTLRAKPIGIMNMLDNGEKDNKIIAVCVDDPEFKDYNDISELPPFRLAEIRGFFQVSLRRLGVRGRERVTEVCGLQPTGERGSER